ncbi:MAG: hypothetical protein RIT26_385 [Pseudomonadota bacterium]|jgi:uncharacterized membrane protein
MTAHTASVLSTPTATQSDRQLLDRLRHHRRDHRRCNELPAHGPAPKAPTLGQRVADRVAATVGSWAFISLQSVLITAWIGWNLANGSQAWDPYPFILLNLVLSFQAAYTAPAIMMSQNRQAEVDRQNANNDYEVNVKAELEIELLHEKIDLLREQEIRDLSAAVRALSAQLQALQKP